jgi:hypothetical protein
LEKKKEREAKDAVAMKDKILLKADKLKKD